MDEADRLHQVLESVAERLAGVLEGAHFERGDGYCFMAFPTFPIRGLNGIWADTDAAADQLAARRAQAKELGTPFTVMTRTGKTPAVEAAARELGLTNEIRIPGMTVTAQELNDFSGDLEVIRVETADGLAQALAVGASGFGVPADLVASIYALEVAELEGLETYLGRVDGRDVSTAVGFTIGGTTGIFSVATPEEHRGRGYGAAITAHAVRDGFAAGADLAGLQSSPMGESVYRRLGFREVERYTLFGPPPKSH
ncbi:MAG: GNAT family N-acetyltransferase [Actinomycetota bacterium]|nr:GNAT family N-acetyltransferase [Actinomycetota bacterium]